MAKKELDELKKEQKDVGKLKGLNEKLKEEMSTLRAMLAAQAKESAASDKHNKEIEEREAKIKGLEKRIAELEKELAEARKKLEEAEKSIHEQKSLAEKDKAEISQLQKQVREAANQGGGHMRRGTNDSMASGSDTGVSQEVLAEHRSKVARLEERLEYERRLRYEADAEINKLRAAVKDNLPLDSEEMKALLVPSESGVSSEASSLVDGESYPRYVIFFSE